MDTKSGGLIMKIGIILRSFSMFFVFSFVYIVFRGLYSSFDTSEFLDYSDYGKFLTKSFYVIAGIVIPASIFYSMVFGVNRRANSKVVIPAVLLLIILLELFVYK
jgi:hypothetical protein